MTVPKPRLRRFPLGIVGLAVALAACKGKPAGPPPQSAAHVDSSGGESQYSLMSSSVSWLTDSNLVALATIVNESAIRLARVESQQSTDQQVHEFAIEQISDHAAVQSSIDSLASKHRVPSQLPAVAMSVQAPYDSIVARLSGLPAQQVDPKYLALDDELHRRAVTDFAALGGNATDPDLRALLAIRAIAMEQRHLARAAQLAARIAEADSAKQSARAGRKP